MDHQAFNTFYNQTNELLFGYVTRLCGDPLLSEDIVQEAYLRFLQNPPKQANYFAQKAYLYTIVTRLVTDHFRDMKRSKGFKDLNEIPDTDPIDTKSDDDPIGATMAELNHTEKSLLWLAYVEGYEHKEIGHIMSLKPKSIRVLLFRARQRFKQLLNQKKNK